MLMLRACLLALLCTFGLAHAASPCATPLDVTRSLLDNLQSDGNWNPGLASACFPAGEDADKAAIQLKQILDARGLLIDFNALSSDPDFVNEQDQSIQILHRSEPRIFVAKKADAWQFSPDTVAAIPAMYADTFSGLARAMRELMPAPLHKPLLLGIQGWQLALLAFLILAAILSGQIAHRVLSRQVVRIAKRLHVDVSDQIVERMQKPLMWAAMGAVFQWGIPDLQFGVRTSQGLNGIARLVLSVAIVLVFLRLVDVISDFFSAKAELTDTKLDDQLIPLANRAAKVVVVALGVLSVLDNLGVDVTSLLAGVTISGLAIALAAKDTVENLFGSVMIFIDRPFQIDDYIVVGSIEGTVVEVGFRSTRVRTPVGSIVSIPNGRIATAQVDNLGMRTERRLRITLGFTYDSSREQISTFCDRLRALFESHEKVSEGYEVQFVNFGDSALEVMLHAFLQVDGWSEELAVKSDLYMQAWSIADELGLVFAFPSQSLYVESLPSDSASA